MKFSKITGGFLLLTAIGCAQTFAATGDSLNRALELNESAIRKMKAGNYDGAEMDLLQALEYSGQEPRLRKNLGVVFYEKGVRAVRQKKDFQEGQSYLRRALDIEPENPNYKKGYASALFLEANIRAGQGYADRALMLYEQAAEWDGENSMAWVQAAHFAWKTHKIDRARRYYERAKALNPGDRNVKILEKKLSQAVTPEGPSRTGSQHFILSADQSFMKNLGSHNILYDLEEAYNKVSFKLSHYPKNKIAVVFYPAEDFHRHWRMPDRVSAFYDGKLRIPYMDPNTPVNVMQPIIMHELTHALVYTMNKQPIPRWLNEGLAQWVEGKQLDAETRKKFLDYAKAGRVPSVIHLDKILADTRSGNNTGVTLAYMKSLSLVEYLIDQRGAWAVVQLIKDYHPSQPLNVWFKKYFYGSVREVEKLWLKWLERR